MTPAELPRVAASAPVAPFFEKDLDALIINALLMVKDFDRRSFSTDERPMTSADTSWLSAEELPDPVNPFTGAPLDGSPKAASELHVFGTDEWNIAANNGNAFPPGFWYAVPDDIRVPANWQLPGEPLFFCGFHILPHKLLRASYEIKK